MAAERLVAWLVAREVAVLADVRLNPISRKPGMSKTKLSSAIEAAGFRYMHVRALGNPSDNRLAFASDGEARRRYEELLSKPSAEEALFELEALANERRVALLCVEADERACHRQLIMQRLMTVGIARLAV